MSLGANEFVTVLDSDGIDFLEGVENVMKVTTGMALRDVLLKASRHNGNFYKKLRLCIHGGMNRRGEMGHGLSVGGRFYYYETAEQDWGVIKGSFHDIVIVGCGAAYGREGEAYCSAISKYTQAVVFASTDIQNFPYSKKPRTLKLPRIWQGKVYGFNPNGSSFPVHYRIT